MGTPSAASRTLSRGSQGLTVAGHGGARGGAEQRRRRYDDESARTGESKGEDGIGSGGFLTSTRNSGDGSRRRGLASVGDRCWRCELTTAAMATARLGLRWGQRLLLGLEMEAADTALGFYGGGET